MSNISYRSNDKNFLWYKYFIVSFFILTLAVEINVSN